MARCRECSQEFEGAQQETCPFCGAARPRPAIRRPAATAAPPEDWSRPVEGFEDPDGGWNTPPVRPATQPSPPPPRGYGPPVVPPHLEPAYPIDEDALDRDHAAGVLGDTPEWQAARKTVLWTTGGCIAMAGAVFLVSRTLLSEDNALLSTRLNVGALLTVLLYVIVAFIVAFQLSEGKIRPEYAQPGEERRAVFVGLAVGALGAMVMVGLNALVTGDVASDENMMSLFFEQAWIHAAVMVAIAIIAAPLVEELLYRGLLAESFRTKGRSTALWISAVAFSAWHLNPGQFRYYVAMGFILGSLYWRFGLNGSITAHAAFNATLAVLAMVAVSGPATPLQIGALTMQLPPGWHVADADEVGAVPAPGDSPFERDGFVVTVTGSGFLVEHVTVPGGLAQVKTAIATAGTPFRDVTVAQGLGVRFTETIDGLKHDLVVFERATTIYSLEFISGGSARAERDFEEMLKTISVSSV